MAKNETATTATTATTAKKRGRSESPFAPKVRITVATHKGLAGTSFPKFEQVLEQFITKEMGLQVRTTMHDPRPQRPGAKGPAVTYKSGMVYIAPKDYVWSATTDPQNSLKKDTRNVALENAKGYGLSLDEYLSKVLAGEIAPVNPALAK